MEGPKALNTVARDIEGKPIESSESNQSGIWLFVDRNNPTHFFAPNFLPPYNTPEKHKIIMDVLKEKWDEKTLSWKPCGLDSHVPKSEDTTSPLLKRLETAIEGVVDEAMWHVKVGAHVLCGNADTVREEMRTNPQDSK